MYQKTSRFIALLIGFAGLTSGMAYSAPVEAQSDTAYKIGVVDIKQVFSTYDRQKQEYANLQRERDTKQAEIDKLSAKITAAKDRYEKDRDKLSETERVQLEDQINADYSQYKAEFKRLQEDIDRQEKRLMETLFEDIRTAIQEVGVRGDYHLILEIGSPLDRTVLYHSTTLDITQQVTDHVNSKFAGKS